MGLNYVELAVLGLMQKAGQGGRGRGSKRGEKQDVNKARVINSAHWP
jgi:hypothetical protein